jgi:hypothetical protein
MLNEKGGQLIIDDVDKSIALRLEGDNEEFVVVVEVREVDVAVQEWCVDQVLDRVQGQR